MQRFLKAFELMYIKTFLTTILFLFAISIYGQDDEVKKHDDEHTSETSPCGSHDEGFDPGATAFHHIADANVYSIGPLQVPLPCILYNKDSGWDIFLSSKFGFNRLGYGEGHYAYKGYVLDGGTVKMIADPSFPKEKTEIKGIYHDDEAKAFVCFGDQVYPTYSKSTADFGLFGGRITPFFFLTFNVSMLITHAAVL